MADLDAIVAARRHLGGQLAAFRTAAGLNQHRFARMMHYARSTVACVETGRQNASRAFWVQADDIVAADGALLRSHDELQTMIRTRLLDRTAMADDPGGNGIPAADLTWTPYAGPPRTGVGSQDVHVIGAMLGAITASDRQFGGGHARQFAEAYLAEVVMPCLCAPAPDRVHRDMVVVATAFTLRTATMAMEVDDLGGCARLLAAAGSIAATVDEPSLTAWVLARRGEYELATYRPAAAVAYTAGAAGMARHLPATTRAFILGKHALALSATDRREDALRMVAEASSTLSGEQPANEPAWMSIYGPHHMQHDAARCYANLGMGERTAHLAAAAASERRRAGQARPTALSLGLQSIGHARAGQVEQACTVAQEMVAIAATVQSARLRTLTRAVLDTLAPHRQLPAVRDLTAAARELAALSAAALR